MFEALLIGLVPLLAIFAAENQYRTRRKFKEAAEILGLRYIGTDRPSLRGDYRGAELTLSEISDHHGEAQLCARCPIDLNLSIAPATQHLSHRLPQRVFTGAAEFDARFVVLGDARAALLALTPAARDLLLNQTAKSIVHLKDGALVLQCASNNEPGVQLVQLAKSASAICRALTWAGAPIECDGALIRARAAQEKHREALLHLYAAIFSYADAIAKEEAQRLLKTEAPHEVALIAAEALGDQARVREEAQNLLSAPSRTRRTKGALALARLGDPQAELPLLALLDQGDPAAQEELLEALGQCASVTAVELLLPFTRGLRHSRSLKHRARTAIAQIQERAGPTPRGSLSVLPAEPDKHGALSVDQQGDLSLSQPDDLQRE